MDESCEASRAVLVNDVGEAARYGIRNDAEDRGEWREHCAPAKTVDVLEAGLDGKKSDARGVRRSKRRAILL